MNAKDQVRNVAQQMREEAILNAYAVVAMLGLKGDDLSEREVFTLYGRAWVKDRVETGLLHFNRVGSSERSAKMYSRFEIETLRRAEKQIEDQYAQAAIVLRNLQDRVEK